MWMSAQHLDYVKVILTALTYLDPTTAHATQVTRQMTEIQVAVDLRIHVKVSFLLRFNFMDSVSEYLAFQTSTKITTH